MTDTLVWYIASTVIFTCLSHQDGQSLLMWASKNGRVEIVRMLLSAGAKVNLQDAVSINSLSLLSHCNLY